MDKILKDIFYDNQIMPLLDAYINENKDILCSGINDGALSFFIFNAFKRSNRNMVVIVKDTKTALALEDALGNLTDQAIYFPSKEIVFFDSYAHSNDLRNKRISALKRFKDNNPQIIIATIESFLVKMVEKDFWYSQYEMINMDSLIDLENLTNQLIALGYERTDMVQSKGHFSIRGGIIDLYPITSDSPIRLELFGDEIDSIRTFDISTQRTLDEITEFQFGPCREIILNEQGQKRLMKGLEKGLETKGIKESKKQDYAMYIEMLKEGVYIDGLNNYFSLIYDDYSTLLDYIDNPIVSIVAPNIISEKADFFINDLRERFKNYLESGEVLAKQFDMMISFVELVSVVKKYQSLFVDDLEKRLLNFEYDNRLSFTTKEAPNYYKKLDELYTDLKNWISKGYQILVLVSDEKKINALNQYLIEKGLSVDLSCEKLIPGKVCIRQSRHQDGFIFDETKSVILTEHEIYGVRKYKKSKFSHDKSKIIKNYEELSVNDLVVHEEHGIGRFMGVHKLHVMNNDNDYLKIKYKGSGVLYIPVNQMDLIQKYIGKKKASVKLSNLNSDQWKKKKARVKKAIEEMTDELIQLYSKRKNSKGYEFSSDSQWQREFEDLFPYEETEDQLVCIDEIKEDMEKPVPMERLLCGDVGYGKTEVAIRAIFKAVDNGKQVVFLVPTTILAQQHYSNLKKRFEKYPINVDVLSRFKTKKEQDHTVEKLRKGMVDIIVGTHRVLSKDVTFKDLGLLVIDEEQRFGVKDKEKIKFIKENVDILSMTATPIPRTLHMSLIGIRDMSVIEDPPENRYPIQTYVTEFDEVIVKEAILREVGRSGQVYFVHNRVKDIEEFSHRIQKLLPNVRIRYAHGQMSNRKLEKLMLDFLDYEFDVLISTTIIETGLDIPRVNTILINDADYFGLSQLYQLRGRVGRSNKIAYAYLLYKRNKVLTEVAEKRLKAIKNFTELGAGFKIAMRDLEIRGAGNLLGVSQHGEMEAVGYELYTKLLEESIHKAKGEKVEERIETSVNLNVNAYIPDDYVPYVNQKLEMYKKVSLIEKEEDIVDLQLEFIDRFGDLPKSVVALIDVSFLKVMLEKLNISDMTEKGNTIGFSFTDDGSFDIEIISYLLKNYKKNVKMPDQFKPYFEYKFWNKDIDEYEKLQVINNMIKRVYNAFN